MSYYDKNAPCLPPVRRKLNFKIPDGFYTKIRLE